MANTMRDKKGKKGIEFDSGTLSLEDQICPHCNSDFEYVLMLERTCKKSGNTVLEYPISKNSICHKGQDIETIKTVVLDPGTLLINKIGIRSK